LAVTVAIRHAGHHPDELIWHDLECGGYTIDLRHWERLAARAGRSVLELGCGSGRVALHLARRGFEVLGVDNDPVLVAALDARARERRAPAEALVADVLALDLGRRFDAVIAPMQLVQLLAGADERRLCLAGIAAHLRPTGLAAVALVDAPPPTAGGSPPLPDLRESEGWVFSSSPTTVHSEEGSIVVRRLRQRVSPAGERSEEPNEVRLSELAPAQLEQEARSWLRACERIAIPPSAEHVGSTIVVMEPA
jgi:SAM-dependent methyltransferase